MQTAVLLLTVTAALLLAPRVGRAECSPDDPLADPPVPEPGGSVVCSGGDSDGFGRSGVSNLSVQVTPSANIAGIILADAGGQSISVAAGATVTSFVRPGVTLSALALSNVGGGSISNAGDVSTGAAETPAIFGSGSNLTIENSGTVATGGNESAAIDLLGVLVATVNNSGTLTTTGIEAHAIDGLGSGLFVDNFGTIGTTGEGASAVYLEGGASPSLIDVTNHADMTTAGETAPAVVVEAEEASIQNDGRITTQGFFSPAMVVVGANATIENRNQVTTSGIQSAGLASLEGGATLTNSGTIRTTGDDAAGMQAGLAFLGYIQQSDGNTLTNTGTVDVAGTDAAGLFAVGSGNTLTNGAVGNLLASGTGSSGIRVGVSTPGLAVDANGNTLRNRGTLTSAGIDGHGLFAAGSNNTLTNEGTLRVDGTGGDGLGASGDGNTLTNEAAGEIQVRSGAVGMRYDGDSGSATNLGFIDVAAEDADGISMTGNFLDATNSGEIEVSGGGSGVVMRGSEAIANNEATGTITTTAGSSEGIWMTEGGRIRNFGDVRTFGDDASGLVVSGTAGRLARVENFGSVSTIGARAYGIEAGRDAPVTDGLVSLTGSIVTEGDDADGIHVTGEVYDVQIGETGGIVTSGAGADGVVLNGFGNGLDHRGEIVVQGADAAGVRFGEAIALQSLSNRGSITSSGDAVVGSDSDQAIFQSGTITGDIRLEGGDDLLSISEGSVFVGVANGGIGGFDELAVETSSIDTLVGPQFVEFETFRKTGSGLLGVQGDLFIDLALVEQGLLAIQPGTTLHAETGVSVAAGATLLGTGTVNGDIVADPGSFVAPGLSIGTLVVTGDLVLDGTLEIEVGGASPSQSDLIQVLGAATLGSGEILLTFVDDYTPMEGDIFSFLEAESLLGFDAAALRYSGLPTGYAFSLEVSGSRLGATTTAVPEPSVATLVGLGLAGLGAGRRRRKRC